MRRTVLVSLVVVAGCKPDAPAPAPVASAPAAPVAAPPRAPVAAPLDPLRVEAEQGNRDALARMVEAIACPQHAPSQFARYCAAATDFAGGTADDLPEGDTTLIGVAAIIEPGPPSVRTLGTGMPVVLRLHRAGTQISGKQIALRETAQRDGLATVLGRTDKAIDGTWDHVDVPAGFAEQIANLGTAPLDPLELADHALWPAEHDGMELRRAHGRWILLGGVDGPAGRHVVAIFADKMKVLGAKDRSTQTITIMHL